MDLMEFMVLELRRNGKEFPKNISKNGPINNFLQILWWVFSNTGLNMYIFLSPERLFSRKDVTLDKLNFRPHIRQNFVFVKNQDIKN